MPPPMKEYLIFFIFQGRKRGSFLAIVHILFSNVICPLVFDSLESSFSFSFLACINFSFSDSSCSTELGGRISNLSSVFLVSYLRILSVISLIFCCMSRISALTKSGVSCRDVISPFQITSPSNVIVVSRKLSSFFILFMSSFFFPFISCGRAERRRFLFISVSILSAGCVFICECVAESPWPAIPLAAICTHTTSSPSSCGACSRRTGTWGTRAGGTGPTRGRAARGACWPRRD